MALEKEIETYKRKLPELATEDGKFVVIQGDAILGVYTTYEDALKVGYERCKLEPFLVKKIDTLERGLFFTRNLRFEKCHTSA